MKSQVLRIIDFNGIETVWRPTKVGKFEIRAVEIGFAGAASNPHTIFRGEVKEGYFFDSEVQHLKSSLDQLRNHTRHGAARLDLCNTEDMLINKLIEKYEQRIKQLEGKI